jgi:hypothetical protein
MAANVTPLFVLTSHIGMVRFSTANSNRDGTGTTGDVITGATFGTRVDRIITKAGSTTTAGMIRLYIYDGSSATRLWKEVLVTAITPSATVASWESIIFSPDPNVPLLVLPNGYILRCSTVNGESFDCIAHGGDY